MAGGGSWCYICVGCVRNFCKRTNKHEKNDVGLGFAPDDETLHMEAVLIVRDGRQGFFFLLRLSHSSWLPFPHTIRSQFVFLRARSKQEKGGVWCDGIDLGCEPRSDVPGGNMVVLARLLGPCSHDHERKKACTCWFSFGTADDHGL